MEAGSLRDRAGLFALIAVPWLCVAVVAAESWAYGRNNLVRNGRWLSSKSLMERPVNGAASFLWSRNALLQDELNLGAWYGSHELTYQRPVAPRRVELSFRVRHGAGLAVFFDRGESGYRGVRLSRHADWPSLGFAADRESRFLQRFPLEQPGDDGWHRLKLEFEERAVAVFVDGAPAGHVPRAGEGSGLFGFRALAAGGWIDDLVIEDRLGVVELAERFDNRTEFRAAVERLLLMALLLAALFALLSGSPRGRWAAWTAATTGFALVLLAVAALAFDRLYWTRRYPYPDRQPGGRAATAVRLEAARNGLFATYPAPLGEHDAPATLLPGPSLRPALTRWDLRRQLPARLLYFPGANRVIVLESEAFAMIPERPPHGVRIAWVGTSQTYGTGSETVLESFVARIQDGLRDALAGRASVDTVNLAVPGWHSGQLLARLRNALPRLRPDLVVVQLGNNDFDPSKLEQNVRDGDARPLLRRAPGPGSRGERPTPRPPPPAQEPRGAPARGQRGAGLPRLRSARPPERRGVTRHRLPGLGQRSFHLARTGGHRRLPVVAAAADRR